MEGREAAVPQNRKTPRYRAVLFDFDGTLFDTSEGIFESLRYAFACDGKAPPDDAVLRKFVGPPIYESFKTLFGYPDEKIDFMVEKYRERYRESGWRAVRVYDGVPALLGTLSACGVKIATASSKPVAYIEQILREQGLLPLFDYLGGTQFDDRHTSKTDVIKNTMRALGEPAQACVMVGDRLYDIRGAKGAGVPCIAVLYGFGSRAEFEAYGADYIAETPADAEKLFFEETT